MIRSGRVASGVMVLTATLVGLSASALAGPGPVDAGLAPVVRRERVLDITLRDTEDREHRLVEHFRQRPIVLEFFTTWNPSSVARVEALRAMHEAMGDRVAFYAVCKEADATVVRAWGAERGLPFPVCIDPGNLEPQGLWTIGSSTTIVLDRSGQNYAMLAPDVPGWDAAVRTYLEQAIEGAPAERAMKMIQDRNTAERLGRLGLPVWESRLVAAGTCMGVSVDAASGRMVILPSSNTVRVLDAAYQTVETTRLSGTVVLKIVPVRAGDRIGAVGFSVWSDHVSVVDPRDGTARLHRTPHGMNDAQPLDLDGDGVDEILLGLNGAGGISAMRIDGTRLWSNTTIGNVSSVHAGDLVGDAGLEIAAVHAGSDVRIFNGAGEDVASAPSPLSPTFVRIAPVADRPGRSALFVAGYEGDRYGIAMINLRGQKRWSRVFDAFHAKRGSVDVSPSGRWYAVLVAQSANEARDSYIVLGDMRTGEPVAAAPASSGWAIAWRSEDDAELLLLASVDGLFEIRPPLLPGASE
jgi:hypothetical protein